MRKLLEPIKIGNMELRNRVVLSAMAKYFCTNGYIGREYCEYYRNIAHGGTALIIPGIMCVEPKWYGQHEQPFLNDDKYIPGLKMAIDAVHDGQAVGQHGDGRVERAGKAVVRAISEGSLVVQMRANRRPEPLVIDISARRRHALGRFLLGRHKEVVNADQARGIHFRQ